MATAYRVEFIPNLSFLELATIPGKITTLVTALNDYSSSNIWVVYSVEDVPNKGILVFMRSP